MKFFLVLAASLALAGCTTTCDPSKGGFVSGVNGLVSNCYSQNADTQQQQLDQMKAAQRAADDQAQQSDQAVTVDQDRLTALRSNVARLDRTLAGLRWKIAHLKTRNGAEAANVADLRQEIGLQTAQLDEMKTRLDAGGGDYAQTEQQYQSLQRAIHAESGQLQQDQGQ